VFYNLIILGLDRQSRHKHRGKYLEQDHRFRINGWKITRGRSCADLPRVILSSLTQDRQSTPSTILEYNVCAWH